jgi:ribosomal protein L15
MKLHEIKPAPGSTKRRKVVGRGRGSGTEPRQGVGEKDKRRAQGLAFRLGSRRPDAPHPSFAKTGFTNIFKRTTRLLIESLDRFSRVRGHPSTAGISGADPFATRRCQGARNRRLDQGLDGTCPQIQPVGGRED